MAENTARTAPAGRVEGHGRSADEPVVLINVFEVPAEQVDAVIADWRRRAEIMAGMPGFRGYRLHRAIAADARFQLVNVAQWASRAHWEAATANPEFQARIRALQADASTAVSANPALYRVAADHAAE